MTTPQHDFDYDILHATSHRPLPDGPWIMTQTWHDLLFAHWPVKHDALGALLPPGFAVDTCEGRAWIGVVPFYMTNVAPRGVPALPWISAFPELNVRTYVRVGGIPGIYFFSLDASNPAIVVAARTAFHLPYHTATMAFSREGDDIVYDSRRNGAPLDASLTIRYRPIGVASVARPGSLAHFLTERYCLFTVDGHGRTCKVEVHHRPWSLQDAQAEIAVNTMTLANGVELPDVPPLLHFARRQDTVVWPLRRIAPAQ
jgi:uncharacterized protein